MRKRQNRFSLVEAVVSLVILGLFSLGILAFTKPLMDLWNLQTFQYGPAAEGKLAVMRMTREINQVKDRIKCPKLSDQQPPHPIHIALPTRACCPVSRIAGGGGQIVSCEVAAAPPSGTDPALVEPDPIRNDPAAATLCAE